MEVGLLSQQDKYPYPSHYKTAFAFSILLYLRHVVIALRQSYPDVSEEWFRLNTFRLI
jgi:hypothetical protein